VVEPAGRVTYWLLTAVVGLGGLELGGGEGGFVQELCSRLGLEEVELGACYGRSEYAPGHEWPCCDYGAEGGDESEEGLHV